MITEKRKMKKLLIREAVEAAVGCTTTKAYYRQLKKDGSKMVGSAWNPKNRIWKATFVWKQESGFTRGVILAIWNKEMRFNDESLNHYLPIHDWKFGKDKGPVVSISVYTTYDPKDATYWRREDFNAWDRANNS